MFNWTYDLYVQSSYVFIITKDYHNNLLGNSVNYGCYKTYRKANFKIELFFIIVI